MISFKYTAYFYYYRLKRQHGLNQVVHIMIFNHYKTLMTSLTHIVFYFKSSTKRHQSSTPVIHLLTVSKKLHASSQVVQKFTFSK